MTREFVVRFDERTDSVRVVERNVLVYESYHSLIRLTGDEDSLREVLKNVEVNPHLSVLERKTLKDFGETRIRNLHEASA